jgi:hypothetical protein
VAEAYRILHGAEGFARAGPEWIDARKIYRKNIWDFFILI